MRNISTSSRNPLRHMRTLLGIPLPAYFLLLVTCAVAQMPTTEQATDPSTVPDLEFTQTLAPTTCLDPNNLNCNADTLRLSNLSKSQSAMPPQGLLIDSSSSHAHNASPVEPQAAPPELTEFQRFVVSSTGILLPRYGAELFRTRPDRFASNEHAAPPEYLILSSEDELRIHTWGQVNITANVHVDREGDIFLPKIGPVHVAGLSFADAKLQITSAIARLYRNFQCTVDLGEIHSIEIYLTGHAAHPGEYSVNALTTLVDAVFLGGGPSPTGSLRHLQLIRNDKLIADFDLYQLLNHGDKSGDAELRNGDVLFIPPTGSEVALLGSVRTQAIYELRDHESIADLLLMAGGATALAQRTQIAIERVDASGLRHAFQVQLRPQGLQTELVNGDILRLDPIASNFSDTVTLRGAVASPGHYRWHDGMRLSDLMPEREALESRDYWWHRTQLGLPAPEFLDTVQQLKAQDLGASSLIIPRQSGNNQEAGTPTPQNVQRPKSETNWNYAAIERLDRASMRTTLIPFDPGRLVLQQDASQDLELQPGDVITLFTQDDIALPAMQMTRYVRLEGEFAHDGIYSVAPGETLRSLILRAGGLTPNAYLYGSDFSRRATRELEQQRLDDYTSRLEQDMHLNALNSLSQPGAQSTDTARIDQELLARMRQLKATGRIVLNLRPQSVALDALPDLQLEDGDRLIVPAKPSTIQVMGAVMNPNAFLYRAHGRVSDYLREAGGPNREADKAHIFILRADGSVTPMARAQSIFAANFFSERLNPGDTLVVPEKLWKPSVLAQAMPWVEIFSNFALGAAALSTFK